MRVSKCYDLDTIRQLHGLCFPHDEVPTAAFLERGDWWVVVHEGEPVAFCGSETYQCDTDGKVCELTRAGVLRSARGQGLQRRMIRARCKAAKAQGCHMLKTYACASNIHSLRNLVLEGFVPYAHEVSDGAGELVWLARDTGVPRGRLKS